MDIVRMEGGLGNQLFQYALYRQLQLMGRSVKMDVTTEYGREGDRTPMLWALNTVYEVASREEINRLTDGFMDLPSRIRRKLTGRKTRKYAESGSNFDPVVLQKTPVYLTGYFQSEKYFPDAKEALFKELTFSERIFDGISKELKDIVKGYERQIGCSQSDSNLCLDSDLDSKVNPTLGLDSCSNSASASTSDIDLAPDSVSLHIRRGDYLEHPEIYGRSCTTEYYQTAVKLMKERHPNARFFVFTNDADWTGQWLQQNFDDSFTLIQGTGEETGYLDLMLMSRCKHQIMANSSFSWWGAWLNRNPEKLVIAPCPWFGDRDFHDIYTEEMIRISPNGEIV